MTAMRICIECVLPETFPGADIDGSGVCTHCRRQPARKDRLLEDKKRYQRKFLDLLARVRESGRGGDYDLLMAYSGGKDSTYTLQLLRAKYGLRVLAVSLDNGFVSETARANTLEVTKRLGVDHIYFRPKWDLMKTIFTRAAAEELFPKKTLERASTICTACISLVKSICVKTALDQRIPMIGFGWSPGQAPVQSSIMRHNPSLLKMTQRAVLEPLRAVAGDDVAAYFLGERHFSLPPDAWPHNVHPMAWEHYDEKMILAEISKLGWKAPADTDTNSSNCLLNAYANELHIRKFGFHPYVWEIANMVREGVMSREEGYAKIYSEQRKELVDAARAALGLSGPGAHGA